MMRRKVLMSATAVLCVALTACSSNSSSSDSTTKRVKNAALTTTSIAGSSTTNAPSTTVTPVEAAVTVSDPGNYTPTYLAPGDAAGSPRVNMTSEANLATNASRTVSNSLKTDSTGNLTVTAAEWIDSSPMTLKWTVKAGTRSIACNNCAFLTTHTKKALAALLGSDVAAGIASIQGVRPTQVGPGEFIGHGWAFEAVVNAPTVHEQIRNGVAIREWVTNCTGTTASTCRNTKLGIAQLHWRNSYWSVADCTSALVNGGPRRLHHDYAARASAANAELKARLKIAAAIDRVYIALPIYRPIFATTGSARSLTGYASTGCAS